MGAADGKVEESVNDDDSENEFNAEEAIEIDCGVVDSGEGTEVQCKVCWGSD